MVTKEQRAELYKLQCEKMKPEYDGSSAFCAKDFRCYRCGKDLLDDPKVLENVKAGHLITGCPFCCVSYCE